MLNFNDLGKGLALVLLHGFCEDLTIWKELANNLQEEFRVVCIDLPGFGKSKVLQDDLDFWAKACFEVLDKQEIQSFSLIGHSLGGYVALAMMEQAPTRIRQFVSFHSSPYSDSEERKANRLKQVAHIETYGVKTFTKQLIPSLFAPEYSGSGLELSLKLAEEQSPEGIISALKAMRLRPDRSELFKNFDSPILLLSGHHDVLLPIADQNLLAESSKNAKIHVLTESGHMGMLEEPTESFDVLRSFLKEML